MEKSELGAKILMSWGLAPEGVSTIDDVEHWAWVPVDSVSMVDQNPQQSADQSGLCWDVFGTPKWYGVSMVGVHHTEHDTMIEQFVLACFGPISQPLPPNRLCAVRRAVVGVDAPPDYLVFDHVAIVRIRRMNPDGLYDILDFVGRLIHERNA